MKEDKDLNYDSMTIEAIEARMTPREIKFIEQYELTGSPMLAAQYVGYMLKNNNSASSYGCKILRRPKIIAYRRARLQEIFDRLSITPQNVLIRADELYRRSLKEIPNMIWNNVTKAHEPDGTLTYDAKTAVIALRMMGEALGMFGKQVPLSVTQESIEEYLKRMGDQA